MSQSATAPNDLASTAARAPSSRLPSIDLLRGIAALSVLFFHAFNYGNTYGSGTVMPLQSPLFRALYAIFNQGNQGVVLFFVLSGFCIHARCASQIARGGPCSVGTGDFLLRRAHRLYPTYLAALACSMSLLVASYVMGKRVTTLAAYGDHPVHGMVVDFFAHASMLHGLSPDFWKTGGNAALWSLAVECYFYLMYLPLLVCRRRWGLRSTFIAVLLLGVVINLFATHWLDPDNPWLGWLQGSAIVLWVQWYMGAVVAEAYFSGQAMPGPRTCFALAPILFAASMWADKHNPVAAPVLWGLTFMMLLVGCLGIERAGRWPTNRLATWLAAVGVFSYSLYLVHLPVLSSTRYLLSRHVTTTNPAIYLSTAAVMIVVGYLAGWTFFLIIERHFLKYPWGGRRHGIAPAASTAAISQAPAQPTPAAAAAR